MDLTTQYLEDWLRDLKVIIFESSVSVMNLKRIIHPADKYEKIIRDDGFFEHFYRQLTFTIIVQLSKLFIDRKSERRSFYRLFNRLQYDKYANCLKRRLQGNRKEVNLLKNKNEVIAEVKALRCTMDEQSDLFERIKILRDKYFAHADPYPELPKVTFEELESLVNLAVNFFNAISGGIYNLTFMFDADDAWKVGPVLEILALHKRGELDGIEVKRDQ